jgi:hypothetical protein
MVEPVVLLDGRVTLEEASKQADLFIEPAPTPKQETMAL